MRLSSPQKKALRYTATILIVGAVGYFFAATLIANWSEVEAEHLQFSWLMLAAVVLFAAAIPMSGILWGRILTHLDRTVKVKTVEAVAVQCLSWLLKYIPGQVGSIANKLVWGKSRGVGASLIVISFVYENVFLILVSLIPTSVILLAYFGPDLFTSNAGTLLVPLLALVPLLVISNPKIFSWIFRFVGTKLLKRDLSGARFLSTRDTLRFQFAFLFPRIVNGAGFVVTAQAIAPVDASAWLPLATIYVLAGAIGILAFMVPSGLGVREAVIVAIAGQIMPVPQAIILAMVARLLSTVADGVVALIYAGTRYSLRKA